MTVGSDESCVFTDVAITCPHGELVATVATPRTFLASPFASELSNDEVSLLTVLNAGMPSTLKLGRAPGWRVLHLVGLDTRKAAAAKICELSKDCKLDADAMRRKFVLLDQLIAESTSDLRCRLLSLRLFPRDEDAGKQAEREQAAGGAASQAAAHTVNAQLQGTAVERAAVMGSNHKLQKTDSLLTRRRKGGKARGQRVLIGGVALQSLNKDLLAAHRSDFCRVFLRLPPVYGLHRPSDEGSQMFARVSRSEKAKLPMSPTEVPARMDDEDEQDSEERWKLVCIVCECCRASSAAPAVSKRVTHHLRPHEPGSNSLMQRASGACVTAAPCVGVVVLPGGGV